MRKRTSSSPDAAVGGADLDDPIRKFSADREGTRRVGVVVIAGGCGPDCEVVVARRRAGGVPRVRGSGTQQLQQDPLPARWPAPELVLRRNAARGRGGEYDLRARRLGR